MKAKIKSLFLTGFPIALTAFLLVVVFTWAWVEPTQAPPNGNVPAPINVGPTGQAKRGNMMLNTDGLLEYGLLIPYGKVGIGTTTPAAKLDVAGNTKIEGNLEVSGEIKSPLKIANGTGQYLKLPNLTTAERDALTPEYGMMIYNTDSKRVEIYIPEGWSRLEGGLLLGEPCDTASDCASGYCVDGVCCDSACNDKVCQRCDTYSVNGAGHCGYVSSSSEDPDNECTASGCTNTGFCSGSGYSCGVPASGTDPNNACGGSSCCGYCDGAGGCAYVAQGSTCSSPGDPCTATHYRCDGSGSCSKPTYNAWIGCVGNSDTQSCTSRCSAAGYAGCNLMCAGDNVNCDRIPCYDSVKSCSYSCKEAYEALGFWVQCDCYCWDYVYDSPHLYSFNGSDYEFVADFGALGKENEKTYFTEVPREKIKEVEGKYKFKIKGDEKEIAYLDKIYLKITDTNQNDVVINTIDPTYTSKGNLSLITESDDNYLILNPGEELLFLEFDAPELKQGYQRKIEFAAESYHEKIQTSKSQEPLTSYGGADKISEPKSLSELLGLENPFERFLKEIGKK